MKLRLLSSVVLLSLFTIFLRGPIRINTQNLSPVMNTYSGGFPITWFEFYYPSNINLSLKYIYNNFSSNFKIDLLSFSLNMLMVILMIGLIRRFVHYIAPAK